MIIKLKSLLKETIENLPNKLYHGTFLQLIPSIRLHGIIPWGREYRNFMDIDYGVYLADDEDFAGSLIEDTENPNIPDEWLQEIYVIIVDTTKLDKTKFDKDPQMHLTPEEWNDPLIAKSYIYKGIIPTSAFIEIKKGSYQW
jgi:hypothetical protein